MADIRTINGKNIKDATARNDIANIKTEIGTVGLATTNQTIKGALNEINSQIKDIANQIENVGGFDTSKFMYVTKEVEDVDMDLQYTYLLLLAMWQ